MWKQKIHSGLCVQLKKKDYIWIVIMETLIDFQGWQMTYKAPVPG